MRKASFVIPWYGREIPGGAEAECRGVAENLAGRGIPVEVLTTCLHSHGRSWESDHHPPGKTVEGGVEVRRFPIDRRNAHLFNLLNSRILSGRDLPPHHEVSFLTNMVNSRAMYQFISKARGRLFFPLPYLFSTSWMTARLAPSRTIPVACLHDEGYAYLSPLRRAYSACAGMAFLSRAEERLARDLWGLGEERCHLVGAGVDTDRAGSPDKFRAKYQIKESFILYAGRRDATKNTPLLIECFTAYKKARPGSDLKLVLIGDQPIALPTEMAGQIIDLGFIPKEDKADAFAAALLFCQPSLNESFSIVIMESWLNHTPVLVHRGCAVTREHAEESGGGLTFTGPRDFAAAVDLVLEDQAQAFALAEAGRRYVVRNYSWETVCERYVQLLEETPDRPRTAVTREKDRFPQPVLRQVLPSPNPGMDILGETWSIAHNAIQAGWRGGIYSPTGERRPHSGIRPLRWLAEELKPEDLVLVHYDCGLKGNDFLEEILSLIGPGLMLRLHGASLVEPNQIRDLAAFLSLEGEREVLVLAGSEAERFDLERAGFPRVATIPPMLPVMGKRATAIEAQNSPVRLMLFPQGINRSSTATAAHVLRLFRRLLPGTAVRILMRETGVGAGGGKAMRPAGAGSCPEAEIAVVFNLTDLIGALSDSEAVLLPGDSREYNWVTAQLYSKGVPVAHLSPEIDPFLAAEEISILIQDPARRKALVQAQCTEFREKGANSGWEAMETLVKSFPVVERYGPTMGKAGDG